ncbi:hypothetical protein MFRU_038g00010 [Monilinia fructicola]|nr:hypothetical protein MFRU_038g00010 [Monilinia fructicola]
MPFVGDIIASEGMNRLCQELNIEQLMNAHPAWNNKSKIQAIAMLEQIDRYPYGVEWAGVWYDYRANHYNKFGTQQYIRRMYNYGDRREIHCFYLDQALYLKNLDTFQIDTSYKRTAGKWREVIFAQYIEQENIDQLTQLSRVYTDVETAEGFYQLFKNWYRCINEALENADQPPLHFHHIHGNGIKAIVVDMCAKQANGWGCFLSDIDPQHRPWQFHIQSTMIYCLVHYQRGIDNSIIANDGYAGLLKDISIAKSKNDCYALLECVRQDYPDMMGWCTHKEWDWIISGLNEQFFLGDKATFRNCIRNTNAVEASGAQTNRYGKALSLAISIEKGRKHDLRINFGGRDNAILGVTNSWRGRSVYDRINERRKRSLLKQKKNQQFAQENNLLLSDDIPEEQQIHHQSSQLSNSDYNHSSSGRPPRIRRSRRQQSVPIQQQQSNITATLEESVRQADLRIQLANKELELKERQIEIARRDREIRELQCT